MAKKKKENNSEIKSNPIIKQLLTAGLDIFKHFVKDLENKKKIKKIDKMDEQFTAIENLLLKQEKMLQENRRLIENLKNKLMLTEIIIIAFLISILIQLIS